MLSEDNDYLINKNKKLQRDMINFENEKSELEQKVRKLEG
jgi:hypothetical protein